MPKSLLFRLGLLTVPIWGQVANVGTQTTLTRLQPPDLVYQGAFRVPGGSFAGSSFEYGGTALAFNPSNGSLFIVGHDG